MTLYIARPFHHSGHRCHSLYDDHLSLPEWSIGLVALPLVFLRVCSRVTVSVKLKIFPSGRRSYFFWGENIFLAKPEIVAHSLLPLFHPWPNQGGSLITAFHLIRIRYNFHPLSPDDFHPLSSGNFHTLSPGNFHFHQITFIHFHRITFIILITNTCSHLMLFNKVTTIDVTFSTTKISPSRPAIAWFSPGEM